MRIKSIDYNENITRFFVLLNLIVTLILLILSVFDGFIVGFKQSVNNIALLIIKILCLFALCACFFFKLTSRSGKSGRSHTHLYKVIKSYMINGRLFIDVIVIIFLILTLAARDILGLDVAFFFLLIIVLTYSVNDLIKL